MASFEDDGSHSSNVAFHIGRLNARVESLEGRQEKTEGVLTSMDGKLDEIKLSIERAVGARNFTSAIARWTLLAIASGGSIIAAVVEAIGLLKFH